MGLITKNIEFNRAEFLFYVPTEIKFGPGKVESLANELQLEDDLTARTNIMVFTDQAIIAAGLLEKVKRGLAGSAYEIKAIFSDIPSDSDIELIDRAAEQAVECGADLIIALGGGSVMDTAKAVSVVAMHGGSVKDYEGLFLVPGPCLPIIAIPTTCGTGSEVSGILIIKDRAEQRKVTLASPHLFPRLAVLDPEIVATLPPSLIAYTGFDALTHAIESYVSTEHQPIAEALALRAVEMIADNLTMAVKDPANTDARAKLQIAATMAGMAFTNVGVGAVHAIAHAVGAIHGVHHGLSNAIILPYVMEFNLESCPERFASLAKALGVSQGNASDQELGQAAIERVRELQREVDIPADFSTLNVACDEADLMQLTELAMNDLSLPFNPRQAEFDELRELVCRVMGVETAIGQ